MSLKDQFGLWLRAGGRTSEGRGFRESDSGRKNIDAGMITGGNQVGINKKETL